MRHPACDFAQARDAGRACRHRRLAVGRRDQHHAGRPHRGDQPSVTPTARRTRPPSIARGACTPTHIRHSLVNGFYQGWDLHPAQLPTRYAAVYRVLHRRAGPASERLRNSSRRPRRPRSSARCSTMRRRGQGLLNYFLRAMNCGAITGRQSSNELPAGDELRGDRFGARTPSTPAACRQPRVLARESNSFGVRIMAGPVSAGGRRAEASFDRPVRPIGGDEHLVGLSRPNGVRSDEQVVTVRQRDREFGDPRRTPPAPLRPSRTACAAPTGSCGRQTFPGARGGWRRARRSQR